MTINLQSLTPVNLLVNFINKFNSSYNKLLYTLLTSESVWRCVSDFLQIHSSTFSSVYLNCFMLYWLCDQISLNLFTEFMVPHTCYCVSAIYLRQNPGYILTIQNTAALLLTEAGLKCLKERKSGLNYSFHSKYHTFFTTWLQYTLTTRLSFLKASLPRLFLKVFC